MSGPADHSRAIIASLFSPPPGTTAQPNESFIAYVQTFEDVPGSTQKKARFLILAAARDGRLKLHKAKQNSNGTFSIGKTWALEDLRTVEVIKIPVEGMSQPQPLEFILGFNGKVYRYETVMPTSQQAAFLVTVVRCWRRYMQGRGQPDLNLVGFAVDAPSSSGSRSVTPSSMAASSGVPAPRHPRAETSAAATAVSSRPTSAGSSSARSAPGPPPRSEARSAAHLPPPAPHRAGPSQPRAPSPGSPGASSRAPLPGRVPSPPDTRSSDLPYATGPAVRQGGAATGPNAPKIPTYSRAPGRTRTAGPQTEESIGPRDTTRNGQARNAARDRDRERVRNRDREGSATSLSTVQSGPSRTPGHSPPMSKKPTAVEELVDGDTVLNNVEEMLEGFEWRGGGGGGGGGSLSERGKADEIEKRLVGELKALEAASIHAIMESDDRVSSVVKSLDAALAELDKLDNVVAMYKTQLSIMTDDIAHIEGQNRGLQVQTSNQRTLLAELDNLMATIDISESDLVALSQESLESQQGIERLEKAVVSLYKALLSMRDRDMAAANEHVAEYRAKASQFAKRMFEFLSVMFKFQIDLVLNPKDGTRVKTDLPSHAQLEDFLGRYCGLMLFVKEMDRGHYQQICAAYFKAMGDLYRQEITDLLASYRAQIRKATDEDLEASFISKESPTLRQQSMRRAGTLVRNPIDRESKKEKDNKLSGSEAFGRALQQIVPHVSREQTFVSDFLNVNPPETSVTFADYMALEAFFRRGAMKGLIEASSKLNDIKAAMEVIFAWLEHEVKEAIDQILARDNIQIVGILAALDRFALQCEKERNEFLRRLLQKQYQRSLSTLERACKEQIKGIEQTKLTLKKRKGVVPFVRVFPLFVNRVEGQLEGCDDLPVRKVINNNYERIFSTMFDCLQQMAKMDGEGQGGEGKDQLNYHVILIENMHHIIAVFSKQKVAALSTFVAQAKEKYQQNLEAYIRLILRRPLSRVLDFFAGLESLLRTTPPTEVSLHSAYTKASLRRVLSDLRAKDLRKAVDALYKRVDKHFGDTTAGSSSTSSAGGAGAGAGDSGVVLRTVWSACDDEMQRLTGVWKGLIDKCYPDDKVGLDFDQAQVHDIFVKARVSY